MNYQLELKVHGQKFDLKTDSDDFAFYLYRRVIEDFEVEGNNSRVMLLKAYVRQVYELYILQESSEKIIDKIELLI